MSKLNEQKDPRNKETEFGMVDDQLDDKKLEIHFSERTQTTYLKWEKHPKANRYQINYNNGLPSEFVTKNLFKVPDNVDLSKVSIGVRAYYNDKKLGPRQYFNPTTTRFFLIA